MASDDKDDRRVKPRHLACFPAHAKVAEGNRIALIKDVSITGALLLTRAHFKEGARVELSMYLSGDPGDEPNVALGEVVRSERRDKAVADLWSFSAAIRFAEPLIHLEEQIKAVAKHQERVRRSDFPPPND